MDLFTDTSPFVELDNRRFRPMLPTSATSLNEKHSLLLPEHVVKDSSVLDLGSCIGATGYWALRLGAQRYLGVEHQAGYADLSRELLKNFSAAEIATVTAEDYLSKTDEPFDVVCLLGVAHGVFDPLSLIRDAARRAERYLCFDDMGWETDQPVLTVDVATKMPLAGQRAATVGFGWFLSPRAVHQIMGFLGFDLDMAHTFVGPRRWVCRYVRVRGEAQEASFAEQTETWGPQGGTQ
jgi:hypothetical protein